MIFASVCKFSLQQNWTHDCTKENRSCKNQFLDARSFWCFWFQQPNKFNIFFSFFTWCKMSIKWFRNCGMPSAYWYMVTVWKLIYGSRRRQKLHCMYLRKIECIKQNWNIYIYFYEMTLWWSKPFYLEISSTTKSH